jgi:hypothetical protein
MYAGTELRDLEKTKVTIIQNDTKISIFSDITPADR